MMSATWRPYRFWRWVGVQLLLSSLPVVGGIGAIDNKVERTFGINDSHTSFMANAGVGIVWPFSSWGRMVADARYRYVDNATNSFTGNRQNMNDWVFSVGLQIPFGPAPQVARPAPPPAPPAAMPPPPPPPPPAARNFELKADGTFAFAKSDLTPTGRARMHAIRHGAPAEIDGRQGRIESREQSGRGLTRRRFRLAHNDMNAEAEIHGASERRGFVRNEVHRFRKPLFRFRPHQKHVAMFGT